MNRRLAQYLVREDSLLIYLDVLSLRPTSPRLFFCRRVLSDWYSLLENFFRSVRGNPLSVCQVQHDQWETQEGKEPKYVVQWKKREITSMVEKL